MLKSFYAKIDRGEDSYIIKYKFDHYNGNPSGGTIYRIDFELNKKKIPRDLFKKINMIFAWINYLNEEQGIAMLEGINYVEGRSAEDAYGSLWSDLEGVEGVSDEIRFKYLGQYKEIRKKDIKFLIECGIEG